MVDLRGALVRDIKLKTDVARLGEVRVAGARETLSGKALAETRGLSLGESLKSITGMYSIQTGPTISKPIIHGLHGNRY